MLASEQALIELGAELLSSGYDFVTTTPETHRRVIARDPTGRSLRDIFGWSKSFSSDALPARLLHLLEKSEALANEGDLLRSQVRFSSVANLLMMHSAYPTIGADAVFFGPDSYRFVRAIGQKLGELETCRLGTVIDVGAGTGIGGLFVATYCKLPPARVVLGDINERALSFSRVNCAINRISAEVIKADVLKGLPRNAQLVISNPPYLVDAEHRTYRHGGGTFGTDLSIRIANETVDHLGRGGRLILYAGTPIVEGQDVFRASLQPLFDNPYLAVSYQEIDPDVFGEELERAPYDRADRIAAVLLTIDKT